MARESEVIELCAGFCCWGLGIALGSRQTVRTNEKGGEGFMEGKGIRNRKQDYLNHSISVSNHLGLLLLERRKGGDCKQSFPKSISAPFCACSIYFCLWYLLPGL